MAKSRAQQAAIAVSMKKAGKKPKKQFGGTSGNVPSPYGGTGANKPKSNKSAIIAGIIGSSVGAVSAAVAKRKKQKQQKREDEVKEWIQSEVNENDLKKKYGGVPKGYHRMPSGKIMKDSAHKMQKGGQKSYYKEKNTIEPSSSVLSTKGITYNKTAIKNVGDKTIKVTTKTTPSLTGPYTSKKTTIVNNKPNKVQTKTYSKTYNPGGNSITGKNFTTKRSYNKVTKKK